MIYHKAILADLLTPVSAFLKVASESSRAFLLESVEGGEKIGRYSFIGADPSDTFCGSLAEFRNRFPGREDPRPELPPFTGGAVGAFTYDLARELECIPDFHKEAPPAGARAGSVQMDFYPTILAFDHLKHQIVILSREGPQKIKEMEVRLAGSFSPLENLPLLGLEKEGEQAPRETAGKEQRENLKRRSGFDSEQFQEAVTAVQRYIRAGDVFQVVLSQRTEVDFESDPFDVYRALRFINPSPYLFFIRRGETAIAGSSPEMLIRVQERRLQYRPIAGTRRRGLDPAQEAKFERELLEDEKERAEHLMLVDLGRNDLGRVSEFGSVRVESLMFVEKYSHVMHLVSSLTGKLKPGLDRLDALAACFPAGTVTGAPKVRAMEIIEELEPSRRGYYAGAFGYLDYSGNLDTCIGIRTIIMQKGKAFLQAGAGIVADSIPRLEDQECHNKTRALLRAIELAQEM